MAVSRVNQGRCCTLLCNQLFTFTATEAVQLEQDPRIRLPASLKLRLSNRGLRFAILGAMDLLWTPWRYQYVTTADKAKRTGVPKLLDAWPGDLGCVFCNLLASVEYAIAHGMPAQDAERAGAPGASPRGLLPLPEFLPL